MTRSGLAMLCGLALVWATPSAALQDAPFSDGTYVLDGGSYSIEVRAEGNDLVVVEPNKTSTYRRQSDGTYHFYNPNTDTVYGIRIVSDHVIEAFKPGQDDNQPSRLSRLGGPPPRREQAAAPPAPAAAPAPNGHAVLAQSYQERARTDPDNVQSWTACAAAAMKRSVATEAEADVYGRQLALVLKSIMVDPSRSPCEDAIPPALWSAAGGEQVAAPSRPAAPTGELSEAQKEQLRRLNAAADARAEAAKAAAERQRQEQQAFEQRSAEFKAAEERYRRDQAAYEAGVAKAKAEAEEYRRKMEEHQRLLASGKFARPN
jgi:hypothetical protein